jgi:FKBP-type peptidyl-prolyl cis-trans isomerase FklB
MKKITYLLALVALTSITFASCNKGNANLETPKDSLSYAYGVGYGYHISANILQGDSTGAKFDALLKGLADGIKKSGDSTLAYYTTGLNIGASLPKEAKEGLMGDSTLTMDIDILKNALITVLKKGNAQMTDDEANQFVRGIVQKKQEERQLQQYGEGKKVGEDFLLKNKENPAVKTTASGLQYEVIKEGKGAKPTAQSTVKVHYTGTLLDGTVFDSSVERGTPATFGVTQVIPGWTEALQLMPVGSKYKLYIPQELAYGASGNNGIPPFSTLIFEVELLSIEN